MRRLRSWLNLVLLVAPAGLICLFAALLMQRVWAYLNSGPRLAGVVSVEATRALGREVRVRSVVFRSNPWSLIPNRVELGGLSIARGLDPGSGTFAQADKIVVWYDLRQALLSRDIRVPLVQEVELTGPRIVVSRDARGHWDFADLIKPTTGPTRPFADKFSFRNGTVYYSDFDFPRPAGVARQPLQTYIDSLHGVVLIRPNKAMAFDVAGSSDPKLLRDFHVVGIAEPKPIRIAARLAAHDLGLPEFARRLLAPATAHVARGRGDVDLSLLYEPPPRASARTIDLKSLDAHGFVTVNGVAVSAPTLASPLTDLGGALTLNSDSLVGNLNGQFAGVRFTVHGRAMNLRRVAGVGSNASAAPVVALQGSLQSTDYGRIVHAINLSSHLTGLSPIVRNNIMNAAARGDLNFRFVGPLHDPTAALSGRLQYARYDHYRGDNVDVRAFYAHRLVDADARGRFAQGDAFVRGHVTADPTGTFQIEAHGRDLHLTALKEMTGLRLGGIGKLDFAIQGQRHVTPSITTQAQVSDLSYGGQKLSSVYAYAATTGDPLITWGKFKPDPQHRKKLRLETLRVEDGKGFALANGTLDLHTQLVDVNLEADELDLGAIASAARHGAKERAGGKGAVNSTVAAAENAETPEPGFDLNSLQGVGYLRAHLGGTLKRPELAGRASAFAVQAGKAGLDTVTTDFSLDRNSIFVDRAVAQRYPGTLTAHGRITDLQSKDPKLDLTGRLDNVDVADLLDVTGALPNTDTTTQGKSPYVVTGRLFADPIAVTGTMHDVTLSRPVTARLESASVNNLPLPLATAEATYDRSGLHILRAQADVAGGTLSGSGTVGSRYLDLSVAGSGLSLQSLTSALPDEMLPIRRPDIAPGAAEAPVFVPHDVHGTLSFQTHVAGLPREPQVSGGITVANLGYRDFVVGNVQARARYADGRVSVLDASVREPGTPAGQLDTIQVGSLAYNTQKKTVAGVVRWNDVRLQRLGELYTSTALADTPIAAQRSVFFDDLAHSLQGLLSGTLTLSGKTDGPIADITWNGRDIKLKNQAITSVTGSALLDSSHLEIPAPDHPRMSIHVDGPDGTIVGDKIRVVYDKVVDGKVVYGDVNADVNAYNMNLALIRNWLPPQTRKPQPLLDVARQLTGKGDLLGFTVHGKTDSPIIDASASFSNLAYKGFTVDRINLSRATIAEPQIQIEDIELTKSQGTGDPNGPKFIAKVTNGKIGFQWKSPNLPEDGQFELDADIPRQDLNVLSAFGATTTANGKRGLFAADNTGYFQAHAHLSRVMKEWRPIGSLTVVADRLHLENVHTGLRNVSAQLNFANDTVTANGTAQSYIYETNISEKNRVGDQITLSGSLPLNTPANPVNGPEIVLNAPDIKIDETPIPGSAGPGVRGSGSVRGEVGAHIALKRSFSQPLIEGDINVSNTTVQPPSQFGATGGGTFALPINPEFNLTLNLGRNVHLNNSLLNARVDGTAHLTGLLFKKTPSLSAITSPNTEADTGDLTDVAVAPRLPGARPSPDEETPPANNIAVNFRGDFTIREGLLRLPTARFTLLPPGTQAPGTLTVRYPDYDPSQPDQPILGFDVNLAAQTYLNLPTYSTVSGVKRYRVIVVARGRPVVDPVTGQSRLTLNFQTDPPDFSGNQQLLEQRIAGVLGGNALEGIGRNPGQVIVQQFTTVFSNSVIPGIFDRPAEALGFETLSLGYDPVQRLNLIVSRHIVGPLYVTYDRSLSGTYIMYNLKASFRFSDRYQLSYDTDDQNTHRVLLEGVWRF